MSRDSVVGAISTSVRYPHYWDAVLRLDGRNYALQSFFRLTFRRFLCWLP